MFDKKKAIKAKQKVISEIAPSMGASDRSYWEAAIATILEFIEQNPDKLSGEPSSKLHKARAADIDGFYYYCVRNSQISL